jgi:hypothetical protein
MSLSNHTAHVQAAAGTYVSTASAATFWGLHLSDIGVVVSSLAAVACAVIQLLLYLDTRKRRKQETGHGPSEAD